MDEDFVESVLVIVEDVPPGRAVSYGQIADHLGRGGARTIGRIMSLYGGAVPWWRVVRVDGGLAPHLMVEAQHYWRDEGMPVRGGRIDMSQARWILAEPAGQ